jgi:hypothetical protein
MTEKDNFRLFTSPSRLNDERNRKDFSKNIERKKIQAILFFFPYQPSVC